MVPSESPLFGGSFMVNPSFVGGEIVTLFMGLSKAALGFEELHTIFKQAALKTNYRIFPVILLILGCCCTTGFILLIEAPSYV